MRQAQIHLLLKNYVVRPTCMLQSLQPRRSAGQWPVLVLEHLLLNLMEIKDTDRTPFLNCLVTPTGLFGSSVDGFVERFTTAQKSSQAMRHFLPKRSSLAAVSSLLTQQPTKPAPSPI